MTLNLKSVTNLFVPTTLVHRRAAAEAELDTARTAFDAAALRSVEAEGNPEDKRPLAEARKALKEAADRLEAAHSAIATLDAAARAAEAQAQQRAGDEAERAEQARLKNLDDALAEAPIVGKKIDEHIDAIASLVRDLAEIDGRVRTLARDGEIARAIGQSATVTVLLACISYRVLRASGKLRTDFLNSDNPEGRWVFYVPGPKSLIRPKK